jgi:hypothetical protein
MALSSFRRLVASRSHIFNKSSTSGAVDDRKPMGVNDCNPRFVHCFFIGLAPGGTVHRLGRLGCENVALSLSIRYRIHSDASKLLRGVLDRREFGCPVARAGTLLDSHFRDWRRVSPIFCPSHIPNESDLSVWTGLSVSDRCSTRYSVVGCQAS